MDERQIWFCCSDKDGYFAGVLIAASKTEAQRLAWDEYVTNTRPIDGSGIDEWTDYHLSASELTVIPLGASYFGADGEGHLEIEC